MVHCKRALEPVMVKDGLKFMTPTNTTDFGLVIAALMEPTTIVADGKAMEHYNMRGKFGRWEVITDCKMLLEKLVRDHLLDLGRPIGCKVDVDGKRVPIYLANPILIARGAASIRRSLPTLDFVYTERSLQSSWTVCRLEGF